MAITRGRHHRQPRREQSLKTLRSQSTWAKHPASQLNLDETSGISLNLGESTNLVAYITDNGAVESSATTAATNNIKKHAANKTTSNSPYNLLPSSPQRKTSKSTSSP